MEPRRCPSCGHEEVTVSQAAEILGVSYQAVHNFIQTEKFKGAWFEDGMAGRGGGRWLIPLAEVKRMAAARADAKATRKAAKGAA